jgi:glucose/arabinose dehydrogenase
VVVTESTANRLRWIEPDAVATIGEGSGLQDGTAATARFRHPLGVAAAADGSVIVADTNNHAIRRVDPDGQVHTLAGGIYGEGDGSGGQARFRHPAGVAMAEDGTVVVADMVSNTIRRITLDGRVSTVAGHIYGQGDLAAGRPSFRRPEAVAVGVDGSIYVADTGNDRICRLEPSGRSVLVAGRRAPGLPPAPAADLRWPTSLLVLPDGTIYVTDAGHNVVRRITTDGSDIVIDPDPSWRPVALAAVPDGAILAAETHWSPQRNVGRLRTLITP